MDMRGESREYYHICTEGLEKKLLFRDRRDYIYGMNSIPVCALKFNVSVLAFCLMDNHVHFITEGRYEECSAFINEYKRRCSQRLRSKYSEVQALHDLKVSIHHIDSEEYLLSSVAYVLRNPFSTGSKCLPFHYEWCSAGLYFRAGQKHRTVFQGRSEASYRRGKAACRPARIHYGTEAADAAYHASWPLCHQ